MKADIRRMLPSGRMHVDVMALQFPQRMAELALKMRQSLANHPDWLKAHQQEFMKPNQMAPFSPELGLTRAEYDEFVGIMKKGPDLIKVADGVVVVKAQGDTIALEGQGELSFLTHVRMDLAKNQVVTPYGTLKTMTVEKANSHQPGGMWKGWQWKLQVGPEISSPFPPATATSVDLSLGKYLNKKRGILLYHATKVQNRQMLVDNLLMLQFATSK